MFSYKNYKKFSKDVINDKIKFPLKRVYMNDEDIKLMMDNLKNYDYKNRLKNKYSVSKGSNKKNIFEGINTFLVNFSRDYKDFNILSDMFMEDLRMKCKLIGREYSPFEYFHKKSEKLGIITLKKYGVITPYTTSETLWHINEAKACTNFRPTNMVSMIQLFFPDHKTNNIRILDPSSGWGDRLIASIATDSIYTGVDPNTKLLERYEQIIDFFKYPREKITLIQKPFENLDIKKEVKNYKEYDMVFTSPPYFNIEVYSEEKTQSLSDRDNLDVWKKKFFGPYIINAWNSLREGGIYIIVINQKKGDDYIEFMEHLINSLKDSEYLGIITYAELNKIFESQPMFIWKKKIAYRGKKKILTTERLHLRYFHEDDIKSMYKIQSNKNNMKNIAAGKTKNMNEVKKQISNYISEHKKETYLQFFPIILNNDDKIIGYIGYYRANFNDEYLRNKIFIRILIDENHQNKGYGKEILKAFTVMYNYKHIYSMVKMNNKASNKLFEKFYKVKINFNFRGEKYNIYSLYI